MRRSRIPAAAKLRVLEPEAGAPLSLRIDEAGAGQRIDAYLASQVERLSRSQVQQLIESGHVRLNGLPRPKISTRLSSGDRLALDLPSEPTRTDLVPNAAIPLSVLHEDPAFVVVDKAADVVVHPAAGHADDTLVNALVARYAELLTAFPGSERPGIVHRLDRDTSGLIVVARAPAAAAALKAQFKARTVEKRYLTLVRGTPSPTEGIIDAPIGRDPLRRKRMAARPDGKPARTSYHVLASALGYSWVEARPFTGRTHQIRVHLQALGYPVAGDIVYGKRDRRIARLALHAWRLSFDHPTTGERMHFESPLPADLEAALAELGISPREN